MWLAWVTVRDSLWFAPTVAVVVAIALALGIVRVPNPRPDTLAARLWLGGGPEGARQILSAIATSLITVTGVMFSVTIVALQLASSQFTPRVLRSFVADRTNQLVLAIFIGTFTYSLLVLRTIRSGTEGEEAFVPHVGVLVAMLLLLLSVGALILFVNHAARSVQASVILEHETTRTLARIAELFPDELSEPDWHTPDSPSLPEVPGRAIASPKAGYVQMVRADALDQLASGNALTIRMDVRIGAFVLPGQPLATVWPVDSVDDAVGELIGEAFLLGPERTPEQDAEYGIVEISDIAVRALSPGVNDPTTAVLCIDRLSEILAALARRRPPQPVRDTRDGSLRFIARHTSFARATGLAFDQIRHHGASNPTIVKKLLDTLGTLLTLVPASERASLLEHVEAIDKGSELAIAHPVDRRAIAELLEQVRRA